MIATNTNVRRKSFDPAAVQLNIAKALGETKKQLGCTLKTIERLSGLDDSTISKVLDASRKIQFRYVEDIVHAFNKLGANVTVEDMVLRYNTPEDVANLPPKHGFERFLDRHRQVPGPATVREAAAVRQLVRGKKVNGGGGKFTKVEIDETITRVYVVEPMTAMRFVKDQLYAVKIGGESKVLTFPFVVSDAAAEFEVIGRVVSDSIK